LHRALTKILFSGKDKKIGVNEEAGESKSIKMKPSIVRKAHLKAIEQGKTLGRGIEDAIDEKVEREETEKAVK
jgi:hypothetical protein